MQICSNFLRCFHATVAKPSIHRGTLSALSLLILGILFLSFATLSAQAQATELFISEYIEGSSFNKAIEIYNGTGAAVDLSTYSVELYSNANTTPNGTATLSGTLADGDVYVLANSRADPTIIAASDLQNDSVINFNGNDSIVLLNNGTVVDSFGQIAADPSEWPGGGANDTLRRQSAICNGDTNPNDAFDASVEWDVFASNTIDDLGSHTATCDNTGGGGGPSTNIIINEVDADTAGTDALEFVELYDGGAGNTDLGGLVVVFHNGSDDASYAAYDLDGFSTDANGYFLLGNAGVFPAPSIVFASSGLQNGADAVALYAGDAADFPTDTPITTTDLLDAIVYDTNDSDDAALLTLLNAGQPQVNEGGKGNKDSDSNQRCPNGDGGQLNTSSFDQFAPTPGAENTCGGGGGGNGTLGNCTDPATLISAIQGAGLASPLVGTTDVVVEGVVVGDYQDTVTGLDGFFVQEEDSDADGEPNTSEGIFIYDNGFGVDVAIGDVVRVLGDVTEFFDLTELNNVSGVAVCSSGATVTAGSISLPVASLDEWESLEGMAIEIPQTLYVTDNFTQGRYGEVGLTSNQDRLFNPTQVTSPGQPALDLQEQNDLSRIQLDDGSTVENPEPLPPYIGADNTLRAGDSISSLTGVLGYSFGDYEVHPTGTVNFTRENPREETPADVGGSLKVVSFNVLNYFTTIDTGSSICGPLGVLGCRGADTADEFANQKAKIVDALLDIDGDIVGLIEIENDAGSVAIQDLVAALGGAYDFVNTGEIGTDAIKVAFVYKSASVMPVGPFAVLDSTVDPAFIDTKNRPVLIQTFEENATGARFTVAVNHLKSKGSDCDDVGDPNANDGQGNCNGTRTAAAQALVSYLATDPTGSGDPDFMIIGDLNAYAMEDPIATVEAAGYTNLAVAFEGPNAYSYSFDGQFGTLDYALANPSLVSQITGVTEWHINSDEPRGLDYNNFNQAALYVADQYRASDHDPIIVGLSLDAPATVVVTCGGFDVLLNADGTYSAPSFAGNLIVGTAKGDWINGTSGADLIVGLAGKDDIYGRKGDDVICGGPGKDVIYGQGGNDTLYGDEKADWLGGGPGADTIFGGAGADDIVGNGGADVVYGGSGKDIMFGGNGGDQLFGEDGRDELYGQSGPDDLDGGNANDFCRGGSGSDTIDNCEGASAADLVAAELDVVDEAALFARNDGEDGEDAVRRSATDLFLPFISVTEPVDASDVPAAASSSVPNESATVEQVPALYLPIVR